VHTHCVSANTVKGTDGRWTALHHPTLFRAAQTAGYLYQAHLRALVAVERRLIAAAQGRASEGVGRVDPEIVSRAIELCGRALNGGQRRAVEAAVSSGHGVQVIEALAGTGKTYTAGVLRFVYQQAGYEVVGVAPTGRAVRELVEEAGIPSRTLDSVVRSLDRDCALPDGGVVVFDEAGMAPTRQTAALLEAAQQVGCKVVAIGDPGQLHSVEAGGWMRAVGRRIGTLRLSDVMRQRDPAERRALAALHDGAPGRWLEWAREHDRIELGPATRLLERAVSEWRAATVDHGLAGAVLIARDNDTRRGLNERARELVREHGGLGTERAYGPVQIAVGDRVICRRNDRKADVDNGTRGTARGVDDRGVAIVTDAGMIRRLPAAYVAAHVEHAYALTGHGMQGGTVERAFVVAAPYELTKGWSYTALSRARAHEPVRDHRQRAAPPRRGCARRAPSCGDRYGDVQAALRLHADSRRRGSRDRAAPDGTRPRALQRPGNGAGGMRRLASQECRAHGALGTGEGDVERVSKRERANPGASCPA
jgi:ATP-dependent exoDNAse (exonuclease V) alpha subunit